MTNSRLLACAVLCAAMDLGLSGCAGAGAQRLRVEYKENPVGIDETHPRFSWEIRSPRRADVQSAYEILVASSRSRLQPGKADLWDSGKIAGDDTLAIPYAGPDLATGQKAFWAVRVWDKDGRAGAVSAPASWEMGLLAPGDWQARWIGAPAALTVSPADAPVGLPLAEARPAAATQLSRPVYANRPAYFRKPFTVGKQIKQARLYATALGLYECSINGQRVGDIVLAPDWTDYHKRVRYQTYDITPLLKRGDNVVGAILGDGWYSGHIGLVNEPGFFGKHPAFLAQVVVEYSDGTREIVATDNTWKVGVGPELGADTLNGTVYDARQEIRGWNTSAFDDARWSTVESRDEKPALEAQIAQPVRQLMELPTKSIAEPKPGAQIFDLGQNMVGYARLKVRGPAGTTLKLRYAEMLNPDGTLYVTNLRRALATDVYTLKGSGEETWEPRFTFHGFRYVEVSGYPGKLTPDAITGIVIASDTPPTGTWESSNPDLNKLYSNIVWGQRGNYVSVPTDCPQRDERLGWMGDAQVFIRTATYNADVDAFFNNWLVDVIDGQHADGSYPDMAPPARTGSGVAAWADAGVICPWTIYQVYGDKRILERQYTSMAAYIDYLKSHSDNLIRPAAGYGDWLSIEAETPKDLLATAYFAYSADLMSRIATLLNKPADAAKFHALCEDIKKAFNAKFVADDGKVAGDTQTGYLLALKMQLVDGDKEQAAVQHLIDAIHAKKDHLSTGFVGVSYLLPMLTKYGHADLAYKLLQQETFPSWLFSVKQGATTIWERWDGWTPDKGFQTPGMNSFNHYSLGSCGEWMFESAAGIAMGEPGFKTVIICPEIGGGLTWVKASYHSVRGDIKTAWRVDGDKVRLDVTIPANVKAEVHLPLPDREWTLDGKVVSTAEPLILGGGTYRFASTSGMVRMVSN